MTTFIPTQEAGLRSLGMTARSNPLEPEWSHLWWGWSHCVRNSCTL